MTNATGTVYFTYTDVDGVAHTVHQLPKNQLESVIRSLRNQGVETGTMKVWNGTTLYVTEDVVIVGGELL